MIFLLGVLLLGIQQYATAPNPQGEVLIINSYHQGYPWSDEEVAGIQSTINEDTLIFIEYMDTKHIESEQYISELAIQYAMKYQDHSFDLIYTLDDKAYQFILQYHDDIFPGVPVVFAGVDNFVESELEGIDWITGTVEYSDYAGQVGLIHQVLPDVTTVYAVTDSTFTGYSYRMQLKEVEEQGLSPLHIDYIGDFEEGPEWNHLIETLSALPQDGTSAILFSGFTRDVTGMSIDTYEAFTEICDAAGVPIFVDFIGHLELGGTGGKLKNPFMDGVYIGEMGIRIMSGTAPNEIPIKRDGNTVYTFDYSALEKWDIPISRLPRSSEIINQPEERVAVSREVLILSGILVLAEATLIFLLIWVNRHRKAAEASLLREQGMLEQTVQKRTVELQTALNVKNQFLANMSHELRTPLTAIMGFSELLIAQTKDILTPKQRSSLQNIFKSGEHLLSLINDVLTMTKINSNQIELAASPVSVEKLIYDAVSMAQSKASAKVITIKKQVNGIVNTIFVDELRMRQVLIVLLDNAIKFSPEGSTINVIVGVQVSDSYELVFSVKDRGIGIKKEDQQKIFEPFVQLDTELSRAHEGSGLGLAVAKQLVELHNGSMGVDSKPGKGTTMIVKLPAYVLRLQSKKAKDRPQQSASVTPMLGPDPITILLAEDNEPIIELLSSIFGGQNVKLLLAANGKEAVSMTRTEKPDILLVDLHLPELDGYTVIRTIRAIPDRAAMPILVISASVFEDEVDQCFQAGADAFLRKPFLIRELFDQIEELLDRK